jgi:hypothetical protein
VWDSVLLFYGELPQKTALCGFGRCFHNHSVMGKKGMCSPLGKG